MRGHGETAGQELSEQAQLITGECERRGFRLLELVVDNEAVNSSARTRPALSYALERIAGHEAEGLVVAELSRLARSAVELGQVMRRLHLAGSRLVAAAEELDTARESGRLAARVLINVSAWERDRLSERTRKGLEAARRLGRRTGRGSVEDYPELRDRILAMRAQGMTLQAIARQLNEEGVPTIRGGAMWRHSSVQAAVGYRRRPAGTLSASEPG